MRRHSLLILLFLLVTALVSCEKPQQQVREQADECAGMAKWPYRDFDLIICSMGEGLSSVRKGQWSGDSIRLFRQKGKDRVLLRDFSETTFGATSGVNIEAEDVSLAVTVFSDTLPDWEAVPLYTEEIDLATGNGIITPLIPVPRYDAQEVARLAAAINKREEEMFPAGSGEDTHGKFLDLVYGNLFKLRDYGFGNPEAIEKKLLSLSECEWNDGEIAEVFSDLLSQVSYMKGKKISLK